jgi:hypothetical protein
LQSLDHAFSYLQTHESQALEYFATANAKQSEIVGNEKYKGLPELQEFVDKFSARAREFQQVYADKNLKEEVKKETSSATTLLSHANTYFNSHHHGQALEYLEEAKIKVCLFDVGGMPWLWHAIDTCNRGL